MTKRALAALSCFVVAFAAAAAAIPRLLPSSVVSQPAKLPDFAARKDRYDVVFLGTSEVFFHVIPAVFDDELRRAGFACRSFNFGLGAMTGSEALSDWRAIRELRPARLRYLFVDLDLLAEPLAQNQMTERAVASYDTSIAWTAWRASRVLPLSHRASLTADLVRAWLLHESNLGIAGDFVAGVLAPDPKTDYGLDDEGYLPATRRLTQPRDFDADAYQQRVREVHSGGLPVSTAPLRQFAAAFVERIIAEAHAAKLTPLLFRGPRLDPPPPVSAAEPRFDFSDVDRYPDLHTPDVRLDDLHLDGEGARRLSVHLARDFADWLRRTGNACALH